MSVNRETTAAARVGFLATGLAVFVLWNLATLAARSPATALGDPRTYGLDAAVGAAFLALLWPRLHRPANRVVAVVAAAVALGLVPLTTAGVPVLAAGGVAAARRPAPADRDRGPSRHDVGRDPGGRPSAATCSSSPGCRCRPGCSSARSSSGSPTCSRSRCSPP